ncbi:hypothetical protein [Actinomadura kijaniata]|uniref:hypothetical protein n=1 Tax=Actinomadura kijaniata TaxID=46161 RepID=UPI000831B982|nr:hypothetical protein [Actinomadura kijaniata]
MPRHPVDYEAALRERHLSALSERINATTRHRAEISDRSRVLVKRRDDVAFGVTAAPIEDTDPPLWGYFFDASDHLIGHVDGLDAVVREIEKRADRNEEAVRVRHLEALQAAIVARTGLRAAIRQPDRGRPHAVEVSGVPRVLGTELIDAAPLPDGTWAYWWRTWSVLIGLVADLDAVVSAVERVMTPKWD